MKIMIEKDEINIKGGRRKKVMFVFGPNFQRLQAIQTFLFPIIFYNFHQKKGQKRKEKIKYYEPV